MKITHVYVRPDGVICACTVPVPEEPSKPGPMSHQEFFTEYYEDDMPKYNKAIESIKSSAVPFEDQKLNSRIADALRSNAKDTFYAIDLEVEIFDTPEYLIDHTSYPPMKKFARMITEKKEPEPVNLDRAALNYAYFARVQSKHNSSF